MTLGCMAEEMGVKSREGGRRPFFSWCCQFSLSAKKLKQSFDRKPNYPKLRKMSEVEPLADLNTSEVPDEVFTAASRARWHDGQVAFDVTYVTWKAAPGQQKVVVRCPIKEFMDTSDATFTCEEVANTVNHWISVAKKFPTTRRNCLCCKNKAKKGGVLCGWCHPVYGETIYAM